MGIFDRFPYSSTHEMNLDFMLGKATEIAESLQEIDTHKEQAEQAATNAAQSATNAAQAAQAAAGSQTAAGTSASQAAQHKADAEDAADRAEAASNLADEAVEQAQTAATHAQTAATNAGTAADGAIASAAAAETRINTLAASLPEDFTELNNEVTGLKSALGYGVYESNTYTTPNQYYRIDPPFELIEGTEYYIYIPDLTDVSSIAIYGMKNGNTNSILNPGVVHEIYFTSPDNYDSLRIVFVLKSAIANKKFYAFVAETNTVKNYSSLIAEIIGTIPMQMNENRPIIDRTLNTAFIKSIVIRDYNNVGYSEYRIPLFVVDEQSLFLYINLEGYNSGTWTSLGKLVELTTPTDAYINKAVETFSGNVTGTNQPIYWSITIDWSLFEGPYQQTNLKISDICAYGQYDDPKYGLLSEAEIINRNVDGYISKDKDPTVITVKKDGTGDFDSIGSAYNSIKDSSFLKQYEIIVFPGIYKEKFLIPPAFTHTHSAYPGTVIVSSEGMSGTEPVFDQRYYSKLSGLRIESGTGYCIHYDWESLAGRAIINEDLYLKKLQYGSIIGGGTYSGGTSYIWKNCIFENGYAACHGYGSIGTREKLCNNDLVFENCQFVQASIDLITTGSLGRYQCDIIGCESQPRHRELVKTSNNGIRSIDDPETYFANTNGWYINAYANRDFIPLLNSSGAGLMFTANAGETTITVTGTAADVLFGRVIKYRNGNANIRATAKGILRVQDQQAGLSGYSTLRDVYQMWKRLGDCSTNSKTLTVTTGNTSKTFTFDKDYLTLKPSEETIISEVNAVITNATLSKFENEPDWDSLHANELAIIQVNGSSGILKDQMITAIGTTCSANAKAYQVYGIALEDSIPNEKAKIWTGNVWVTSLANGEYGVGSDGKLTTTATEKIGYVVNGCFFRY